MDLEQRPGHEFTNLLIFETRFCSLAQGGLELLDSSDPPASVSEVLGRQKHTIPD